MSTSSTSHHGHREPRTPREVRFHTSTAESLRMIYELHDAESTYIKILDFVHDHFFQPIVDSIDSTDPKLQKEELSSIFINFQDIWDRHKAFLATLSANLYLSMPPELPPLIRSHLSASLPMYLQFVADFPAAMDTYAAMAETRIELAIFVAGQEAGQYGNLIAAMLPIVQRCPGYLLSLKDLAGGCSKRDRSSLFEVQALASRIDPLINAPEYSTYNFATLHQHNPIDKFRLDDKVSSPQFIKRGTFLVSGEDKDDFTQWRVRDFLLYTDCLYWLAASGDEDAVPGEDWNWGRGAGHHWAIQWRVNLGNVGVILRDSGELELCISSVSYSVYTSGTADIQEWAEAILRAKFAWAAEVHQADEDTATLNRPKSRRSSHMESIKRRASLSLGSHRQRPSLLRRCGRGLLCMGQNKHYDLSVTDFTL